MSPTRRSTLSLWSSHWFNLGLTLQQFRAFLLFWQGYNWSQIQEMLGYTIHQYIIQWLYPGYCPSSPLCCSSGARWLYPWFFPNPDGYRYIMSGYRHNSWMSPHVLTYSLFSHCLLFLSWLRWHIIWKHHFGRQCFSPFSDGIYCLGISFYNPPSL